MCVAQVFLGKLSVMAASGVIALLMSDLDYYSNPAKYPGTYLSSSLLPVLLSMLIGYIVGAIFFNVWDPSSFCMLHHLRPQWKVCQRQISAAEL